LKTTLSLGLTALHIAAIKGRVHIFEVLQRHKVGVTEHLQARSGPTGRTCLHWAASCGQLEVTRLLYTLAGADFRELIDNRDRQGDTPLHLAARYGHTEIVRTLLGVPSTGTLSRYTDGIRHSGPQSQEAISRP
jgi:ankyrin repeat protein